MTKRHPNGMRITRPYKNEEEFIHGDGLAIGRLGMILIGAPAKPPGITIRFEILLKDETVVFRGEGRVVAHRVHSNGRQGLEIRFTRLDSHSKKLVERVLHLRKEGKLVPPKKRKKKSSSERSSQPDIARPKTETQDDKDSRGTEHSLRLSSPEISTPGPAEPLHEKRSDESSKSDEHEGAAGSSSDTDQSNERADAESTTAKPNEHAQVELEKHETAKIDEPEQSTDTSAADSAPSSRDVAIDIEQDEERAAATDQTSEPHPPQSREKPEQPNDDETTDRDDVSLASVEERAERASSQDTTNEADQDEAPISERQESSSLQVKSQIDSSSDENDRREATEDDDTETTTAPTPEPPLKHEAAEKGLSALRERKADYEPITNRDELLERLRARLRG